MINTAAGLLVPFHRASIGEDEVLAVSEVLRSGWLTMGARTEEFERQFAKYVGAQHAVALSSCTAALHLALEAMGIGPGDEVLLPTTTFTATAASVIYLGGRPALVRRPGDNESSIRIACARIGKVSAELAGG